MPLLKLCKRKKNARLLLFWSLSHPPAWIYNFSYSDCMITTNWKILEAIGKPDHCTCLLRNLYADQEATIRMGHGTMDWFKIGKGICEGCILSPCLFNLYAEYIMRNAQAGIKIARRNTNNLRYAGDTTLMAESEEELKSLLIKVKEESEKAGLKFNIQKTKIMESGPITSWQIDGETMKTVENRLFFLGSKITVDSNCGHEVKRHLLLGRKAMKNLDRLKSRDIALPTEGLNSQSHGFSSSRVRIWELDNKKGSALKNWCLRTVVLEKTLVSPLDCKEIKPVSSKGDQSWIFIGRTDAEVEAPKPCPPDSQSQLIGKDSDAGKDWRQEEKGMTEDEMVGWHHQLNGHEFEQTWGDSEGQGSLACCNPWGCKESDRT